jgi:hypothetical protein
MYQVPYITVILTSKHHYTLTILTYQNKTTQVVLSSSNRTRSSTSGGCPVWLLDQFFFSIQLVEGARSLNIGGTWASSLALLPRDSSSLAFQ